MSKYLLLNIVFIVAAVVKIAVINRRIVIQQIILAMIILLVMTAIFDNVIIDLKIVAYDPKTILGIHIGKAPIEDFAYSIVAIVLLPSIWNRLQQRGSKHDS